MADSFFRVSSQLRAAYDKAGLSDVAKRRRSIMKFAKQHDLMYFSSNKNQTLTVPIIRGSTASLDQKDTNICIGTHDGYDIVFLERFGTTTHPGYDTSVHRWHIMSFDLHSHSSLPFIFVGTRQQSKTFYANLFATRREARMLESTFFTGVQRFGAHYTIVASPSEQVVLTQVLTAPITQTMAKYQHPFAVEILEDTLSIITDSQYMTESSLSKMMHYGLWLAKHVDANVS